MNPVLRLRKKRLGWSQAKFGSVAGVSQGTVSKWEAGEGSPSRDELARIREAALEEGIDWQDSWVFEAPPAHTSAEARCP